jgi:hypothetical protein
VNTHQELIQDSKRVINELLGQSGLGKSEERLSKQLAEIQEAARKAYKQEIPEYKPLNEITVPIDQPEIKANKFTKQIEKVNSIILTSVQEYHKLNQGIEDQKGNIELLYVLLDKRRELVKDIISSYENLINLLKNASENPSFSPAKTQILGKLLTVYIGPKEAQNRVGIELPSSQNVSSYREWLKIYQEDLSLALKRDNLSDDKRKELNEEFASNNKKLNTIESIVSKLINDITSGTDPSRKPEGSNQASSSNTLPKMTQSPSPRPPTSTNASLPISNTYLRQPKVVLQERTNNQNYTII